MSNIDFSRIISAGDAADRRLAAHRDAVKAECRRRILSALPFEVQTNIAQAIASHANALASGLDPDGAEAALGLLAEDIAGAAATRDWIARMRAACAELGTDPHAPYRDDTAWPTLPASVAALAARV
ncbi:hypothetical protein SAMN05444398_110131 [Roseovarius pacificus]|uniref:Uncharacterized protein n=1 Tax=Roseovarius pacificus TaxID=337701 RepID=A0A1M7GE41_9RHOB|nr:hypothetical protein [Roseovarius pacificus]GGO59984.1 hypothetical protein GCM10011315_33240 [Roseovarius pacificus]SHM14553.1 hypothetical protein SAMN05444398_110131 [Roseovarius pacificus]